MEKIKEVAGYLLLSFLCAGIIGGIIALIGWFSHWQGLTVYTNVFFLSGIGVFLLSGVLRRQSAPLLEQSLRGHINRGDHLEANATGRRLVQDILTRYSLMVVMILCGVYLIGFSFILTKINPA